MIPKQQAFKEIAADRKTSKGDIKWKLKNWQKKFYTIYK